MQEIKITIWRHQHADDWSIEILGKKFEHVTSIAVSDLLELTLLAAQQDRTDLFSTSPLAFRRAGM